MDEDQTLPGQIVDGICFPSIPPAVYYGPLLDTGKDGFSNASYKKSAAQEAFLLAVQFGDWGCQLGKGDFTESKMNVDFMTRNDVDGGKLTSPAGKEKMKSLQYPPAPVDAGLKSQPQGQQQTGKKAGEGGMELNNYSDEKKMEKMGGKKKSCCKVFARMIFSHVGLSSMVMLYAILGGFVFQASGLGICKHI